MQCGSRLVGDDARNGRCPLFNQRLQKSSVFMLSIGNLVVNASLGTFWVCWRESRRARRCIDLVKPDRHPQSRKPTAAREDAPVSKACSIV